MRYAHTVIDEKICHYYYIYPSNINILMPFRGHNIAIVLSTRKNWLSMHDHVWQRLAHEKLVSPITWEFYFRKADCVAGCMPRKDMVSQHQAHHLIVPCVLAKRMLSIRTYRASTRFIVLVHVSMYPRMPM